MLNVIHTVERGRYVGKIYYDEFVESPREETELNTIITVKLRNQTIGDVEYISQTEILEHICDEVGVDIEELNDSYDWRDTEKYKEKLWEFIEERTTIKNVYKYEHGGIALSTSPFNCPWDSGQIGYIYMLKDIQEKYNISDSRAEQILEAEIDMYSKYLNGDVFAYKIEDEEGNLIDLYSNFYQDLDELEDLILEEIEAQEKADEQNKLKKLKTLIKNNVPLNHRKTILEEA